MLTEKPRILLIDNDQARSALLKQALTDSGLDEIKRIATTHSLLKDVEEIAPDIIIIDVDSPDRDVLESMATLNEVNPHPLVMFSENNSPELIEKALKAGVSAYITEGIQTDRVSSIINVAIARFREYQALKNEIQETRSKLEDRIAIDKAKGILMEQKALNEAMAYKTLRSMSMNSGVKMSILANNIIELFDCPQDEQANC